MRVLPEQAARVAHEATRVLCRLMRNEVLPEWDDLDGRRATLIDAAKFVVANPDEDDGGVHRAWMDAKLLDGWRWGPELDRASKRHPALLPFDELPEEDRRGDRLFRAVVLALMAED